MTAVRALVSRHRLLLPVGLVLAAALIVGCKGVSDPQTYPEPPVVLPPPYFYAVWGNSADDVYVVGQPGLIYHYDGASWSQEDAHTTEVLTDVFGDGAGNVYVTGHSGLILHKSGSGSWSKMTSGTSQDLYAVGKFGTTIYACGREGELRRLSGSTWNAGPREIYVRDPNGAVTDTLYRDEDLLSLTTVFGMGIGGSDGVVLMADPDTDWQLRRVAGGEGWVTDGMGNDAIPSNFISTDHGRLFELRELESGQVSWRARYSPSLGEIVYGIWIDPQYTAYAVTNTGRIMQIAIDDSHFQLYFDGKALFDIWGFSGSNIYAVGIDARILHFTDPGDGGGLRWVQEQVVTPAAKSAAETGLDKFGRRF